MEVKLKALVAKAQGPSPWDVGNQVLYDLCSERPSHGNRSDIIAKIWLIGRSYAAAIERRRNKVEGGDNFYVDTVAPAISRSGIDTWIERARDRDASSEAAWSAMLLAHLKTTELFTRISGLAKRSLASKYLHFHAPECFYIYDARAVGALRLLKDKIVRPASLPAVRADDEYRGFAEKCRSLQDFVASRYGVRLSPRQLDNLLLLVHQQAHK